MLYLVISILAAHHRFDRDGGAAAKPARFQAFWRVAGNAPSVLPLVAMATIFKLMYDAELGARNKGSPPSAWTAQLVRPKPGP